MNAPPPEPPFQDSHVSVPLHSRIGWVVAWVIILILLAMISRNCASSVIYGRNTEMQAVESIYQQGISDGSAGRANKLSGEAEKNPVLRKSYNKGYREGLDRKNRSADHMD